jgi:hypothetical protein
MLNIGKMKTVENPNKQKFVKQLIEEEKKILKATNLADPLNQGTERNPFINLDLCHISF